MQTPPGDAGLTPVVRTLLDYFHRLHPEAGIRIEIPAADGPTVLHPARVPPIPAERLGTHDLAAFEGGTLRLGFDREAVALEEVNRLAESVHLALQSERDARGTARELSDRYEEIDLLYTISEISGSAVATEDAAAGILEELLKVLGARRASLWIHHDDPERLELAAAVGQPGLSGPIAVDDPESATAWVFRENRPLNLEREPAGHGRAPGRPGPRDGDAFLSVPIHFTAPGTAERTIGVLTLVGRRSGHRFSAGDERLLAATASQIGAALQSHRLHQDSLRQERLLREVELAHDLQAKLLPDPAAVDGTAHVAARCVPAQSVGGDFFQVYRLSHDRLGVLIGDVSGHGFPAALIMALTISAIGIYAKEAETPAEVLRRVHRALGRELESTEMFLSLFYGVIDPAEPRIRYANAGHPQAWRLSASGGLQRLGATGPPLGTVPTEPYGERSASWAHGQDLLVLFTDGLSDTFAAARGAGSGEQRLLERVAARMTDTLAAIIDDVFAASDAQGSGLDPDDRTLLLVRT